MIRDSDWFLDKDNVKYMAEVMLAYTEGKVIEYTPDCEDNWEETNTPYWNWDCFEYRVKE